MGILKLLAIISPAIIINAVTIWQLWAKKNKK